VKETIFVAGATGAIGQRLIPLLLADGWSVVGMTRSAGRAEDLRSRGVEAVVADAFDAEAVLKAVTRASPSVVMHQLTDLPRELSKLDAAALARNARLREEGTRNLVAAARAAGARRLVAQSIAFSYAEGPRPYHEGAPLAGDLPDASDTARGVVSLERQVLGSGLEAVVLRYGKLYGPGTGADRPWGSGAVHSDAAAHAALLACRSTATGVFNIAEEDGEVDSARARMELGWSEDWRAP